MLKVSVVMPVYNVEKFVARSIKSVLDQSFTNFELIIINDGSTDNSLSICEKFKDKRIKIFSQTNRGLAGARNTGIRESSGEYVAFLDSDDIWSSQKLHHHVAHLDHKKGVGVSYSPSIFIDNNNCSLGIKQMPKLSNITFEDIMCRNPIGNGSAPVIRRSILDETSFCIYRNGVKERCYFDESFRQSEDIEYWMRIAATSGCRFEGISPNLTYYRVNSSGLSANLEKQLASWERAVSKIAVISPVKVGRCFDKAKAYQYRYLARRAISAGNRVAAISLVGKAFKQCENIFWEEPKKTLSTILATAVLCLLPSRIFCKAYQLAGQVLSLINHSPSPQTK